MMMMIYSEAGSESEDRRQVEWSATDTLTGSGSKRAVLLDPHSNALCMLT